MQTLLKLPLSISLTCMLLADYMQTSLKKRHCSSLSVLDLYFIDPIKIFDVVKVETGDWSSFGQINVVCRSELFRELYFNPGVEKDRFEATGEDGMSNGVFALVIDIIAAVFLRLYHLRFAFAVHSIEEGRLDLPSVPWIVSIFGRPDNDLANCIVHGQCAVARPCMARLGLQSAAWAFFRDTIFAVCSSV